MFEQDVLEFKMNLLRAEIELNGMKAENDLCYMRQWEPKYVYNDFASLIEKYRIYDNALPTCRGE
jgi:hypothetical protein